jgi:hypothetical protein
MYLCLVVIALAGCETAPSSQAPKARVEAKPAAAAKTEPKATPAPTTQPAPAQPAEPEKPATTQPAYDQGPLKAEIDAMREVRTAYADSAERSAMESNFAMRLRLQGEKIKHIVRLGNVILTNVVDDTGHSMVDPNLYTAQDQTMMHPAQQIPADQLAHDGLRLGAKANLPARGARQIKLLKGTIRLVLADKTEKITILNPLQFLGRRIVDPRLKQLGLEIEFMSPTAFSQPPPADRTIILRYQTKPDNVQSVAFFDGNMQPMRYRETHIATAAGEDCSAYMFDAPAFNDEMQLVLEVHPEVEDIQMPIEAANVPLP